MALQAPRPALILGHRRLGLLEGLGRLVLHAVLQELVALVEERLRRAEVFPVGLRLLDLRQQLLLELDGGLGERGSRGEHAGEQDEDSSAAHAYLLGYIDALTRTPANHARGVVRISSVRS